MSASVQIASPQTPFSSRTAASVRGSGVELTLVAVLMTAIGLWAASLGQIDIAHLDDYGLPPALPATWYVAVALLVGGASVAILSRGRRLALAALYVIALVVVLYGTVPALASEPHYSWVYKHIGVVRFLAANGEIDPSIDIYNHWPGFFAFAAVFGRLAGVGNPVQYAAWAEVFFPIVAAGLIAGCVRAVIDDARVFGGAALIFVLANWLGQSYFAPQAFGFTLTLGIVMLLLRSPRPPNALAERIVAGVERVSRRKQFAAVPAARGTEALRIGLVLAMDAVLVVSHQLTPYIALLSVLGLTVFGLVRPIWLVAAMAALTFAYLLLNFGYVERNFGLFTSLDPFANAHHSTLYNTAAGSGKTFSARMAHVLTGLVWTATAASVVRLVRLGLARGALPLVVLACAPFVVVFGQSYGGEAILRVILFSLPWCAGLIAWALATLPPRTQLGGTVAFTGLLAALFVPAFLGQEELNLIPSGEVNASEHFYASAPRGSVLMLSGPDFPVRYGPRYNEFRGPKSDDDPNLLRTSTFRHRALGARDVGSIVAVIHQYSRRGFLVFSTSQYEYARVFRLAPPGQLENLERAVAESRRFRLWYSNPDTRIYQLVGGPAR